ncbi:MAG: pantoate--beta-alanine ligase [Lentimicrobium sp.]|mgnify:CR=1 FL=1|nr:pantoate--beta-alanine ligase [Lentimicrobium sp.]MDD2526979.1 pantoate--beta-alanine ligase [Lentimicrobiaceae bacterium]MDD4597825.1 pantoate--beta-alanine ligase [Lentimicrobiaceae bacterium]MDY0024993.1 pantoate--beta-alanine ligase [Lentimicrobium sp.]HAH57721.1 pantoate--beta-alanine ligase [Bacteroidales bacterium]
MQVFNTIAETHKYSRKARVEGKFIGFVPTMGALHPGHISLVERARKENDLVVVSIFVNPLQFNNPQDLEKYPRDLDKDLKLLREAGCDVVFNPSVAEMYPEEVNKHYDFGSLANVMEGAFRPGHFNGVAIVVNKLFNIVLPYRAYFGEKDFQQLQIIRALVSIEKLDINIVACPISREDDGLARSSRNERLTPEMRKAAPFIYQTLLNARTMAQDSDSGRIIEYVKDQFIMHPLLKLEYFSIAGANDLQPIHGELHPESYGFIAVFAGEIRLIDNIRLI